jgi:predicted transcriptional regulator
MKSVMLSIQPKWCELIASGKKTIEVRKTRPQIETPFKCYIYCTASDVHSCLVVGGGSAELFHCCNYKTAFVGGGVVGNGKVIGEFVCDRIETYDYFIEKPLDELIEGEYRHYLTCSELDCTCLRATELEKYLDEKDGYGWHISDLKIYDTPKELREFRKPCKWEEHGEEPDCFICNKSGYTPDMYIDCFNFLTRPPQSWMFCEVSEC